MTIPEVLQTRPVVRIDPLISVKDAAGLMFAQEIGALVVMEGDELVGLVSERDLMNKVVLTDKTPSDTLVEEVMTREVITVTPETTLDRALHLMSEHHFRHLPVVDERGKPTHMLSFRDLYAYRLKQLEHANQALSTLAQLGVKPS